MRAHFKGSYYLTTTYGTLEHIKSFDQQRSATRQLSREVQDSIHRWERRRTLNQERMSQSSVRVHTHAQAHTHKERPTHIIISAAGQFGGFKETSKQTCLGKNDLTDVYQAGSELVLLFPCVFCRTFSQCAALRLEPTPKLLASSPTPPSSSWRNSAPHASNKVNTPEDSSVQSICIMNQFHK